MEQKEVKMRGQTRVAAIMKAARRNNASLAAFLFP
jgi:hypothetical protein